ncbi:MAG: carbamoyltransferase HypF [Lacibacter sp.]
MMQSWHIHIGGMVQGVGFRPHVYRVAHEMNIKGNVSNTGNGVHINATAEENTLKEFYSNLIHHPPANSIIAHHGAEVIPLQQFNEFSIRESEENLHPSLMITPDFGLCDECRHELSEHKNRRYHYPFTTCTKCGPRYSIITSLPYDRPNTTMAGYEQCWQCKKEYHNPAHRRYYSQTNSCSTCGIPMHLYNSDGEHVCDDYECIMVMIKDALDNGHIIAVKGIGGYLLMADATNHLTINTLRERKQRPSKPLAILYPSLKIAEKDVVITDKEREALQSIEAPIVLCKLQDHPSTGLCTEQAAPGLNKIGVMLPYTPLLALIADAFHKPLIATSGNISGAPIIYNDEQALEYLGEIADFVVTYDREIVVPQDDSVIQFSPMYQQKIILRRSRGYAPNFYPAPFEKNETQVIAMGAELKGSFALLQQNRCYISQYLGDQGSYDAQLSYKQTLEHLGKLLRFEADLCVVDKHPGYNVTENGKNYAAENALPFVEVQHHEAHFAAVLAENSLHETDEQILGVIWDGTGFGNDENIWGGEMFLFRNKRFDRYAHINYFPVLMGDKMAKEPRLSALSVCHYFNEALPLLEDKFSKTEWAHYRNTLQYSNRFVYTSSMGRLLDGIASLLDIADISSYEGEAAMKLEALALQCQEPVNNWYELKLFKNIIYFKPLLEQVVNDLKQKVSKEVIAYKVHLSLAKLVERAAINSGVKKIAFSGGVMQNALLVDLLNGTLKNNFDLYFHKQLSPNDECISFGQLAMIQMASLAGQQKKREEIIFK